ncbi:MAG: ADOP family duplicated permease [Longimicrobiales bacterium]
MNPAPPSILRWLLSWVLPPGPVRDGLLGDLDELYAERVRRGRASAGLWYARQLFWAAVHYPPRRLWTRGLHGEPKGTMEGLARDFGYAFRMLRRRPGFATVIVLTLALGIGANTAVFSVVRSVLLRPLPFPEDERLAVLLLRAPSFGFVDFASSPPEYVAYRDHSRSWEQLAAFRDGTATVTQDGGEPERVEVAFATWNLFPALRIEPLLGRTFTAEDGQEGSDGVAVLSHAFWMSRYGGDPQVIGRTVRLDGVPRTVVGVMPPEFGFPTRDVRLWLPLAFTPGNLQNRGNHSFSIVGRLRPGVTLAAAETELAALIARFTADPSFNFHKWHPAYLRSLRTEIVGDVSRTLWVMLGAVALVLLIACANVANLLLVRAEERAREMSLRTALGAGRRRLISQLLTESLVMAGAGGLAGMALAYVGVVALRGVAPADLPRLDEITMDVTVLAFTTIVTVGAGILFGLVPALHARRADLQGVLREEGRSGTAGRKRIRLRQLLVVSETALAVVLLVAAGLLLQSFRRLMAVDPGFRTESVLAASLTIPSLKYAEGREVVGFYESLLPQIASLPGVIAVGAAREAPLAGGLNASDIEVEGWVNPGDAPRPIGDVQVVTPGYFAAMRIPLLEGRAFEERDGMDAPLLAMVSESLARAYWPGRSALGGRIRLDWDDQPFAEVIGVLPDVRYGELDRPAARGALYLAHAQTPRTAGPFWSMTLTVRTSTEPTSLVSAIRREVHALDPSVPLYQVRTMEQAVADATATQRFSMLLQLLFALVALSLSAVGLYGVLAFTVARRTAEIGIRMALGAERSDVRRMVVGQGMGIVAIALALGVGGALATGRVLGSLLFGVSAGDPVTYATVVGVLLAVALLACWVPARRASGVDPAEALRAE